MHSSKTPEQTNAHPLEMVELAMERAVYLMTGRCDRFSSRGRDN